MSETVSVVIAARHGGRFIAEELRRAFPELIWRPVSHCAGILELAGQAAGADHQKGR